MPLGFVRIPMNSTFILTFKKKKEIIATKTLGRKGFEGSYGVQRATRLGFPSCLVARCQREIRLSQGGYERGHTPSCVREV